MFLFSLSRCTIIHWHLSDFRKYSIAFLEPQRRRQKAEMKLTCHDVLLLLLVSLMFGNQHAVWIKHKHRIQLSICEWKKQLLPPWIHQLLPTPHAWPQPVWSRSTEDVQRPIKCSYNGKHVKKYLCISFNTNFSLYL